MNNNQTAERFTALEIDTVNNPEANLPTAYLCPKLGPPTLKQATFAQLREAVEARAALNEDQRIPTASLEVRAATPTILEADPGPLHPNGAMHLSEICGVPNLVVDYLCKHGDAPIAARYLNNGLPRGDKGAKERLVRTTRGDDGRTWIRAICGDRYTVLDDTLGLDMIEAAIGNDLANLTAWKYGGDAGKTTGQFILEGRTIEIEGDSGYKIGFSYENSEVRGHSYTFKGFVWRNKCFNGCIFGIQQGATVRQIHKGNIDGAELLGRVNLAILRAIEDGPAMVNLFRIGRDLRLKPGMERKTAMALGRRYGLSREEVKGWMRGFEAEPDESAWGMVNGLTRYAQEVSPRRSAELQELAGTMLAPSIYADLQAIERHWERYAALAEDVDDAKLERLFAAVA